MNSRELAAPALPASASPGLPVLTNFAWVVTGNVVFAMCQWGIVVALAKAGSTSMVGQFSLGLAIATPIVMFANCDLRAVQATDARREFDFHEYRRLRTITAACALLVIGAIACSGAYPGRTAMVVAAVGMAKAIEALSDVHYGLFQSRGRLDQIGRSMMLRGVLAVIAMTAVLLATGDVLRGCLAIAAVWLVVLCVFDVSRARGMAHLERTPRRSTAPRLWAIARTALPLGVVTTIASINLQIPRYFVHARMGERNLGLFSALAYATVAMTLVGDSLSHCIVPRLSRLFAGRQHLVFVSHIKKLLLIGCVTGMCGVAFAQLLGARLLRIFYSPEYAAHSQVFILLTVAAAIHLVASLLTTAITASRQFGVQVAMYAAVAACTALGCARWTASAGLQGAAFGVIGGAIARLAISAGVVCRLCGGLS